MFYCRTYRGTEKSDQPQRESTAGDEGKIESVWNLMYQEWGLEIHRMGQVAL